MTADPETCKDCRQPVRWVVTEMGKRIEIDPDPVDDGIIVPVLDGKGRRIARVLSGDQLPAQEPAWRRHSTTCPESPDAKARRARLAPRCRVCLGPMDPELAALEQWETHPCCDIAAAADEVRSALHPSTRTVLTREST